MINKQRVQRIRNVIYAILVLIIFVPIILVIILSFRLIGLLTDISAYYVSNPPAVSEQAPEQSTGVPVIEPDKQSFTGASTVLLESDSLLNDDKGSQGDNMVADGGEYVKNVYSPAAYPALYFDTLPIFYPADKNTLYLTFDNTPASQIDKILSVLDKHNVNATFFVWWNEALGSDNGRFYKKIAAGGHNIGIHAASSEDTYSTIYSSVDFFLKTFNTIFDSIYAETGIKTRLYRLPGGSVAPHNPIRQTMLNSIKTELDARGFLQYDWNSSAEDAVVPTLSKDQILHNITHSLNGGSLLVVLLHDGTGSESTAQALDAFIGEYKTAGYSFKALDVDTKPVSFLDK